MEKPILIVVGTRPDALKLLPVYQVLRQRGVPVLLCATNQHSTLLEQVFQLFDVSPDIQLHVMQAHQTLEHITASVLTKCADVIKTLRPSLVLVQGDTSSSYAAALAAYYNHVPVAHVEAGLRTGNINAPFPEEINRIFIGKIASLHFAPTPLNVANLLDEGVHHTRVLDRKSVV